MNCSMAFRLFFGVAVLAVFGQMHSASGQAADPVRIGVNYETLCSDSMAFARDQLAVVYPQLYDIMQVDINAYGHANDSANAEGGYDFTCQHGPDECAGNLMLACAKSFIAEEKDYVDFNICVMSSDDPPTAGETCATTVAISTWSDINDCWTSTVGENLLHDIGVITHALDPELNYTPWMLYEGNHTAEIQDQMEHDLMTFVCSNYAGETPAACSAD